MAEANFTENVLLGIPSSSLLLTFTIFLGIIFFFENVIRPGKKIKSSQDFLGLKDIPGPPMYEPTGWIGILPALLPVNKTAEKGLEIMRGRNLVKAILLNQTFIVINSAHLVETLLKSADFGYVEKPPIIYHIMKSFLKNGVLISTGKFWQHQRKVLLKSQSYQSLKAYMGLLNKHSDNFVSDLDELFKDGKAHQINDLINVLFLKVISEMITGYDKKDSEELLRYHHNFQHWKSTFAERLFHPWLLLEPLWRLLPKSKRLDVAIEEMFEFARNRIHEHKDNITKDFSEAKKPAKFRSVLQGLVEAGVEEEQIIAEINTMMFGGHETGAGAIHYFLFCMALNPDIQIECQKEVDALFEENENGIQYDAVIGGLKLVERCILETMRLFPPIFIFMRKLNKELELNDKGKKYLIPSGTNVIVAPFTLHRKPEYFPNPEEFNPDRFLPDECAKRHAYSYVPFSAGPRNCLGQKFAMMEMKTIAAYTLRHFSISTRDKLEDIPVLPLLTLSPAKDFTFNFKRRNSKIF